MKEFHILHIELWLEYSIKVSFIMAVRAISLMLVQRAAYKTSNRVYSSPRMNECVTDLI